ncbi:hypothetical protein [Haladaptatus pallidirubidus]|uniref:L-alanine-DL-glutamate epimerase n=1 Tax=Haladaptatus pallidirubidus TaxID=1008152 RepID=A0AAV3UQP6_9EURY|nr:hypothetical protein [Haladaptatus pallidirubidus]
MELYDRVRDLEFTIESYDLHFKEENSSGDFARASVVLDVQDELPSVPTFTRPCTQISLSGKGMEGYGEDVTYDHVDHRTLTKSPATLPLAGEYSIESFSAALNEIDLFPGRPPERKASLFYRRWAFESAALDLALKQAGLNLATIFDREYDPVRFVVSNRLGDPPTFDRIATWLELDSNLEFKLDATSDWSAALINDLAATETIRILDFKGQYRGTMVDQPPDPILYRQIIDQFPDALIEDPVLTTETRLLFDGVDHRITWDAPITGIQSIEELPFEPDWVNIKPSRFGALKPLFDTIEYCLDHDIKMYGGGQTELGVGRQHIHALASLFYPSSPNDIAPRAYNRPEPTPGLPTSPLSPPSNPSGLEWR